MCESMGHIPGLLPGWACCKCNTYSKAQELTCHMCGHKPCDGEVKGQVTSWLFVTTKPTALKRWKPTISAEKEEERENGRDS